MALSVAGSSHCRGGLRCVCVSTRVHAPCWYKLALPLTLLSVFFFFFFQENTRKGEKRHQFWCPLSTLLNRSTQRLQGSGGQLLRVASSSFCVCVSETEHGWCGRRGNAGACVYFPPDLPPSLPSSSSSFSTEECRYILIEKAFRKNKTQKKTIYSNRRKLNSVKQNYRERAK